LEFFKAFALSGQNLIDDRLQVSYEPILHLLHHLRVEIDLLQLGILMIIAFLLELFNYNLQDSFVGKFIFLLQFLYYLISFRSRGGHLLSFLGGHVLVEHFATLAILGEDVVLRGGGLMIWF
jgi:hypothetical protein